MRLLRRVVDFFRGVLGEEDIAIGARRPWRPAWDSGVRAERL